MLLPRSVTLRKLRSLPGRSMALELRACVLGFLRRISISLWLGASPGKANRISAHMARSFAETLSENTLLQASALMDERFYRERNERYSNDRASIRTTSSFGMSSSHGANTALLSLGLFRRDFFFSSDSTSAPVKQERTEYSMLLVDSLNYPLLSSPTSDNHLVGNVSVTFEPRSIVRRSDAGNSLLTTGNYSALSSLLVPNEVSSLHLATMGRLDFYTENSNAFGAQARMSYEENTENVSLLSNEIVGIDPASITKLAETLDESSFSGRTTLAGLSMHYGPDIQDLFQFEGNARLLNYDTPSQNNDDDHDELVTSADISYHRLFSNELNGGLDFRASQTHLVYLKSDRSAQNNVTHSVALGSEGIYTGQTFYGKIQGEVFANYTVLDYLDSLPILQSVGNYVLRGVTLTDSSLIPLGIRPFAAAGPLTLEDGVVLRISERGSYNPGEFSERRDTRITELSTSLLLGLSSVDGPAPWSIRAGVRGFFLSRSGRSQLSIAAQQIFGELERQTRIGPYALISLTRSNNTGPALIGSIWYAVIKSQTFDIPTISRTPQLESHLQVQWTF